MPAGSRASSSHGDGTRSARPRALAVEQADYDAKVAARFEQEAALRMSGWPPSNPRWFMKEKLTRGSAVRHGDRA